VKNSAHLPIPQHAVKTEVIFCVRGVYPPPCDCAEKKASMPRNA
jgi:hypothetical protein